MKRAIKQISIKVSGRQDLNRGSTAFAITLRPVHRKTKSK